MKLKLTAILLAFAMLSSVAMSTSSSMMLTTATANSNGFTTEYRCGKVTTTNGQASGTLSDVAIGDALNVLMAVARMSSSTILNTSNPDRARAHRAALTQHSGVTPWQDAAAVQATDVSISNALNVLMMVARMRSSAIFDCNADDGCTWCKSGVAATLPQAPGVSNDFRNLTAAELFGEMRAGWNLGNTLDAHRTMPDERHWLELEPIERVETIWLSTNEYTRQTLIQSVKAQGFDTIRIPVTWYKVADRNNNWKIREDWMEHVQKIVDWAMDEGMYVILNTHHEEYVMPLFDDGVDLSKVVVRRFWEQISEAFNNDYNERLIFEGLNEPRTIGSQFEWQGGEAEERANLNALNQIFVETVRASGGNNAYRVLAVPTYAASADNRAFTGFTIPTDTQANTTDGVSHKIAISIHAYQPGNFSYARTGSVSTFNGRAAIQNTITRIRNNANTLKVPVFIGEFGSVNKNNTAERAEHAKVYTEIAREAGIACIWWDNRSTAFANSANIESFGLIARTPPHAILSTASAGSFTPIAEGLLEGAGPTPPKVAARPGPPAN